MYSHLFNVWGDIPKTRAISQFTTTSFASRKNFEARTKEPIVTLNKKEYD